MVTQTIPVEKPPHIDETRMRHIADADLFAALDLSRPGLARVRAAADQADWPAADDAWSRYVAERAHPIPIVDKGSYARYLRETGDPGAGAIIEAATTLWTQEVDYIDPAKGKSRLYGFHYMGWMTPLIDAYALTGDDRHVAAFVRLFNQWYDTRDQVRGEWQMDVIWYSLGLSIRSVTFSLAYSTFRRSPALDPQTGARLLKTFLGAARWLAEEHDAFRYGNWQHHGVTGLFELATFWPEFREAPQWADVAWARLLDHLELDVYPDGGHLERAPSYHGGVLNGYSHVALAAELNWNQRLQDHPRFHELYRWLMAHCTPLGCSTNFNDSGLVWVGPHMVTGAVLCGDPELKWLAEQFGTPREIGGTLAALPKRPDGQSAAQAYEDLPSKAPVAASSLLPTSKFAIMRGGAGWGPDDLSITISYGPHVGHELESHSHLDPLSFVCSGYGAPLAVEAGGPDSYDDPRYYDWYQAACSHNVVTVDGEDPAADFKDAELLIWSPTPIADIFQAAHDGYAEAKGVRHRRTIIFVRDDYWVIHDELDQTQGAHRLDWHLYTPAESRLDGDRFIPASGPGLMVLPTISEPGDTAEIVHGMMVVARSRAYDGAFDRREVAGVRYRRQTDAPRTAFLNVLYPVGPGSAIPSVTVEPLTIQGGSGEACAIVGPRGRDILVVGAGSEPAHRQVDEWRSDARVWLIRKSGSWSACHVSQLHHQRDPIFTASSPVESIAIRPDDGGLAGEVVTRRKTLIRPRANPGWSQITVNGVVVPPVDGSPDPGFLLPAPGHYRFEVR